MPKTKTSDAIAVQSFDDGVAQFVKGLEDAALVRGAGTDPGHVFEDFLECGYCSMAKVSWQQLARIGFTGLEEKIEALEARYMLVVKRTNKEYMGCMAKLLAIAAASLECSLGDFFGTVAGRLDKLSSRLGQFFTPYALAEMTARMTLGDSWPNHIAKNGLLTLAEPASGGGAMLAACATVLQERLRKGDLPYQLHRHVYFEAVDVSPLAFKMTYILCSLCGLAGRVVHGNTLTLEHFETAYTPLYYMLFTNSAYLRYRFGPPKGSDVGGSVPQAKPVGVRPELWTSPAMRNFAKLMRRHEEKQSPFWYKAK